MTLEESSSVEGIEVPPPWSPPYLPKLRQSLAGTAPILPSTIMAAKLVISKVCREIDLAEIPRVLEVYLSSISEADISECRTWALRRAVYHGNLAAVRYFIEQERIPVDVVSLEDVAADPTTYPTTELFQILLDHGWDINMDGYRSGPDREQCLLKLVCSDESLVRWCLDHGAKVKDLHNDPTGYYSPPILELVASRGTLAIFKLLYSRGAELGTRTLHKAARSAKHQGLALVKYLVDTVGLDINALDCDRLLPNHPGTTICYVIESYEGGEDAVRFLLSRGADPWIRDCYGTMDAFERAERVKNYAVIKVLQEWKEQNMKE